MSRPSLVNGSAVSRRRFLHTAGLVSGGSLVWPGLASCLPAAEPGAPQLEPLNRFPRMMQDFYVDQLRAIEQRGLARKQALKTKADAEAYIVDVRQKIRQAFGPEPERTPLNAKVIRTVERDAYRIENVIFESRPQFFVTANLYLPKKVTKPVPGVVGSCGHSVNGKAHDAYQSFAQGLARQGYAALIFDPIGQGERLQYVDEQLKPRRGVGTSEHMYAGNQQALVGEFFGAWRAWDGIRALDYLLSRPEVDPQHVGITGNSGGGTMTTWLCGLDQRWTMAAPSCFVTTFRRNLENELPADTEQCPPRILSLGLDMDDVLAAMAPKPVIILAKERDYFDARGSEETYHRLKRLYTLLGKPDNIGLFIGPTEHGYSQENREAMYAWFNRATGASDAKGEPALTPEKDETLHCTPHGQVAELRSRTVFSFTQEKANGLAKGRPTLDEPGLQRTVRQVLHLPELKGAPDYRILRPWGKRGYAKANTTTYFVESEPGVGAIVTRLTDAPHLSRPPQDTHPATLYVAHLSADAELRETPWLRELCTKEPDGTMFACDVRGIGDSRPNTCGENATKSSYGSDYFYTSHGIMLDRPYVGQRTHDVLNVLEWLAAQGHAQVHLVGRGRGSIPAAFAALLSPHVSRVTLYESLDSYDSVASREEYDWPMSSFITGVLAHFDLPEVYRVLAGKQLQRVATAKG